MKWSKIVLAGLLAILVIQPVGTIAQEKAPADKPEEKKEELKPLLLEEVTVTVTGLTVPFMDFPGTVHVVTKQDIEDWHPIYSQQLLERVPGVIALSEDEAGLRPSIGIRGLDPIRSRGGVVLLIDGIPFNPAPYADPGAYYNVPIQRIERIEVIEKGPLAPVLANRPAAPAQGTKKGPGLFLCLDLHPSNIREMAPQVNRGHVRRAG